LKLKIFRLENYLQGNKPKKLPLVCNACGHIIQEGEKYETTYLGNNYYCHNCIKKPILVYPIRMCKPFNREQKKLELLEGKTDA